jgi:hypothetical protein
MRVVGPDLRPDPVADNPRDAVPDADGAAVRRSDGRAPHFNPAIDLGASRLVGQIGAGMRCAKRWNA